MPKMLMKLSAGDSSKENSMMSLYESRSELTETQQVRTKENVSNIAVAALRYNSILRAATAITTVIWIDIRIITKTDLRPAIGHNSIKRAQKKFNEICF